MASSRGAVDRRTQTQNSKFCPPEILIVVRQTGSPAAQTLNLREKRGKPTFTQFRDRHVLGTAKPPSVTRDRNHVSQGGYVDAPPRRGPNSLVLQFVRTQ